MDTFQNLTIGLNVIMMMKFRSFCFTEMIGPMTDVPHVLQIKAWTSQDIS